ncbi:hypothetical protein C7967_11563 [Thalassospira sp. 11-3]|nr:hypothetical protein C7967_11563 [Thalassospira sp. 11-3]
MHGYRLVIKILVYLTLALSSVMVGLNFITGSPYVSWSLYMGSDTLYPLLLATLLSISIALVTRGYTHPERHSVLFSKWGIDVSLEGLNKYAGVVFALVLVFAVSHPSWYVQNMHNILTGIGMFLVHLELWTYYQGEKKRSWRIYSVLGIVGFLLAYIFNLYTIGLGEILVTLPVIGHILKTNK